MERIDYNSINSMEDRDQHIVPINTIQTKRTTPINFDLLKLDSNEQKGNLLTLLGKYHQYSQLFWRNWGTFT